MVKFCKFVYSHKTKNVKWWDQGRLARAYIIYRTKMMWHSELSLNIQNLSFGKILHLVLLSAGFINHLSDPLPYPFHIVKRNSNISLKKQNELKGSKL